MSKHSDALLVLAVTFLLAILQSDSVIALSNLNSRVKHVVMFSIQDDVSEEKVKGQSTVISYFGILRL